MSVVGPSTHPLDRPIWSALTTRQRTLAEGGARALRYPAAVAPFADMADMSPESFAALGAIMSGSEIAVLFTPDAGAERDDDSRLRASVASRSRLRPTAAWRDFP